MKDNEIITALGCCWRNANHIECTSNCPMYEYCESDQEDDMNICGLALDLINRQRAEIEIFKAELKFYKDKKEMKESEEKNNARKINKIVERVQA